MYYNYRLENRANEEPATILFTSATRKKGHSTSPGRVVLGLPSPSPRVCTDGRTDGWTYADVRTKIFRINGLPNFLTHGAPRAPLLELYLKNHFTPVQMAQLFLLFCVSTKTIRPHLNDFQLHVEKHSCLRETELDDEM